MHLGKHSEIEASESLYDSLRHDWAMKFSSLTLESKIGTLEVTGKVKSEVCKMGWALQKTRGSGKGIFQAGFKAVKEQAEKPIPRKLQQK